MIGEESVCLLHRHPSMKMRWTSIGSIHVVMNAEFVLFININEVLCSDILRSIHDFLCHFCCAGLQDWLQERRTKLCHAVFGFTLFHGLLCHVSEKLVQHTTVWLTTPERLWNMVLFLHFVVVVLQSDVYILVMVVSNPHKQLGSVIHYTSAGT